MVGHQYMREYKMIKIGISLWGYIYDWTVANTPDGGRLFHQQYINKLIHSNFDVYLLQKKRDQPLLLNSLDLNTNLHYTESALPDLDVLLCEYRWPTYKNYGHDKTEPDYDRQTELIDHYYGKIPIIVWDQDLKVDEAFTKKYPKIIIADACLNTNRLQLFYPCNLDNDTYKIHTSFLDSKYLVYCGNNYERYKMFAKYIQSSAKILPGGVHVYGNWLQFSPERISPISVKKLFPDVIFHDRISYDKVEDTLNKAFSTICITKDSYNEKGLVVSRFIEAIRCKTLLLGTSEFYGIHNLLPSECIVSNGEELVDFISSLSLKNREVLINKTFEKFNNSGVASLDKWIKTIKGVL
jgi:hypothetical protein